MFHTLFSRALNKLSKTKKKDVKQKSKVVNTQSKTKSQNEHDLIKNKTKKKN